MSGISRESVLLFPPFCSNRIFFLFFFIPFFRSEKQSTMATRSVLRQQVFGLELRCPHLHGVDIYVHIFREPWDNGVFENGRENVVGTYISFYSWWRFLMWLFGRKINRQIWGFENFDWYFIIFIIACRQIFTVTIEILLYSTYLMQTLIKHKI